MIPEERIFAAFRGKEKEAFRSALLNIAWAFQSLQNEESLVGPIFIRIIESKATGPSWDRAALRELITESAVKMRAAAQQLEDAARKLYGP